jgi:glutathione peroxidase-family protein
MLRLAVEKALRGSGRMVSYPTSFLISRDGKVVKRVHGLIDYQEATQAIESQL